MATKPKKILVHTCCLACASHVFSSLQKAGFDVICLFYNPEISDKDEYDRRLDGLKNYCEETGVELIGLPYAPDDFGKLIKLYTDKNSLKYINDEERYRRRRCQICNSIKIDKTIEQAAKLKTKFFTTTLLCSPYKDHDTIIELANEKALDYNLTFYYQDFRKGYWMGRNWAKNHGAYTPRFCGCADSIKELRFE